MPEVLGCQILLEKLLGVVSKLLLPRPVAFIENVIFGGRELGCLETRSPC